MAESEMEKWDQAAVDYQRVFNLGLNDYNALLMRFWHEEGMLFPSCRVVDIGCGVGKYGTYFAELGYDVTLTDISGKMLRHARENMSKYGTPWTVYQCDFNEATGREPVFADGFDLAISTMSPAVHDAATVRKMGAMTRGWCFLARFYDWKQPFRDTLMREMGMKPRKVFDDLQGDVDALYAAVKKAGYFPQIRIVPYNWEDRRTPEQMADYMFRNYFAEDPEPERLKAEALRISGELSGADGCVIDDVRTSVAWIFWKTEVKEHDS